MANSFFHFMGCSTFAEYAVIADISGPRSIPELTWTRCVSKGVACPPAGALSSTTPRWSPGPPWLCCRAGGPQGSPQHQAAKVLLLGQGGSGVDINDAKFEKALEMGPLREQHDLRGRDGRPC